MNFRWKQMVRYQYYVKIAGVGQKRAQFTGVDSCAATIRKNRITLISCDGHNLRKKDPKVYPAGVPDHMGWAGFVLRPQYYDFDDGCAPITHGYPVRLGFQQNHNP